MVEDIRQRLLLANLSKSPTFERERRSRWLTPATPPDKEKFDVLQTVYGQEQEILHGVVQRIESAAEARDQFRIAVDPGEETRYLLLADACRKLLQVFQHVPASLFDELSLFERWMAWQLPESSPFELRPLTLRRLERAIPAPERRTGPVRERLLASLKAVESALDGHGNLRANQTWKGLLEHVQSIKPSSQVTIAVRKVQEQLQCGAREMIDSSKDRPSQQAAIYLERGLGRSLLEWVQTGITQAESGDEVTPFDSPNSPEARLQLVTREASRGKPSEVTKDVHAFGCSW